MFRPQSLPALALVAMAACASGVAEKPNTQSDPANALAPQASPATLPSLNDPDRILGNPAATAPADHGNMPMENGKAAPVYTCPMHSEICARTPGRCPKCGMTLVPASPDGGANR